MEKSQMYAEALLRMRSLQDKFNLNPMILQYLEEDMLLFSWYDLGVAAGCDMIDNDECYEEAVKEFEEKTGNFVYHVIEKKMWADAGEYQISSLENDVDEPVIMLTFLYVSHDEESWKEERLNGDHLLAFVVTCDTDDMVSFGKYGYVCLGSEGGALIRKAYFPYGDEDEMIKDLDEPDDIRNLLNEMI